MLLSEENICEALRLHSETLKLETVGSDTTVATARGRVLRRRSSSLCIASPCFMLEPCIELSSQDNCTTASSTSTGDTYCPRDREGVVSPPRNKVFPSLHHFPREADLPSCVPDRAARDRRLACASRRPHRYGLSGGTPSPRRPSAWSKSAGIHSRSSSSRFRHRGDLRPSQPP